MRKCANLHRVILLGMWESCSRWFIINRSYAVGSKSDVYLDERPDSPPAGRKIPFFFTKMLHKVQHFCEKDKDSTMLPQAFLTFGVGTSPEQTPTA